tara:strand:+ start:215 stop:424 length:210 start_codon:yes stop_codon:yes gene_type:complete
MIPRDLQRAGHGGSMFKRCNAANAVFRGQPEGLVPISHISVLLVARLANALQHASRLELYEMGRQRRPE